MLRAHSWLFTQGSLLAEIRGSYWDPEIKLRLTICKSGTFLAAISLHPLELLVQLRFFHGVSS